MAHEAAYPINACGQALELGGAPMYLGFQVPLPGRVTGDQVKPLVRFRRLPGLERLPETINGSWAYSIAPAHPEQHRYIAERSRTSVGQL